MEMDFSHIIWDMPGAGIEAESFRRIEAETPAALRARFGEAEWRVARRLVHTGANFAVLEQLEFTPGALRAVARKALAKDTGARGLRSIMEEIMLDILYELPDQPSGGKYIITESIIEGRERLFDDVQTRAKTA